MSRPNGHSALKTHLMSKILVIDDTPFWREFTGDVLRDKGHTVFTAADGLDGLAALRANGADLIVLDVEMPRLAGFSFLDQIRREEHWKSVPVIIFTGNLRKEDILRAKELGVIDYVIKSKFDIPSLVNRVQKRLADLGLAPTAVPAADQAFPPPLVLGGKIPMGAERRFGPRQQKT